MGKVEKRRLEDWPSITIIGPPGARKTGTSQRVSDLTGLPVVHIDDEIVRVCKKKTLQEVVKFLNGNFAKKEGGVAIRAVKRSTRPTIFDTGGSMIYSPKAMELFKESGLIIYLTASNKTLLKRIAKRLDDRGIDMHGYSSLEELLDSRKPEYEKWADWTISTEGNNVKVVKKLVKQLTRERIVPKLKH